ncbi:uncharacterized protein MONBRDRAFT_33631 [Monosiga brevicollis MX1]|uniref:PDZ domain-containing protein n=1 Tax=Monosiga brevicollis TaxID=81824 RepID=A9V6N6_MONBE|nr:uncharacterized protein MONBRDRAFT_33631 [Monosiga brevicollis MX1]EDQ86766.1 predicted protein [Monosiga brevicollis MX1]|eukprot:XP_001748311.1 hypothetical protein [Monosiga brevicollis MX1]
MSKRNSLFRRAEKTKSHYPQREVTVSRNSQGIFGFEVRGGVENDVISHVHIPSKSKINCTSGSLKDGDLIFVANGKNIIGETHEMVTDLIRNAGPQLRLVVSSPKDSDSAKFSHLVTLSSNIDPQTAKLQAEVKQKLYDMSARFTTRPMHPSEMQGREFNFVSDQEFDQLRSANRFIECSKADDGFWYGTVKPNKDLASRDNRESRRAVLEGRVHADSTKKSAPGAAANGVAGTTPSNGANASRETPRIAVDEPDTSVVSDANAQIQTVVLARRDGRLGFSFKGGIEFGVLLSVREVEHVDIISTTNRGLKPGDCILAVNGVSVAGCTVEEAEAMITKLADPVELTTTCFPPIQRQDNRPGYVKLSEFLHESAADTEDLRQAKIDVKRDIYGLTVPYTTRAPREGEQNGKHYHFISRDTFDEMRNADKFLEWGEKDGVLYGTPKRNREVKASNFRRSASFAHVRGKKIFRPNFVTINRKAGEAIGFDLLSPDGRTFIKSVQPNSPAYQAKLRAGMQIISVNGSDVTESSFEDITKMISSSGDRLTLSVKYDPNGYDEVLALVSSATQNPATEGTTGKSKSVWKTYALYGSAMAAAVAGVVYMYVTNHELFGQSQDDTAVSTPLPAPTPIA